MLIPVIRKVMPELLAAELVGVQPIKPPSGVIFTMNTERTLGLGSIRVNKKELLSKLKENKEIHIDEYEEAMIGFNKSAVAKIKQALKTAKAGKVPKYISFEIPESHEEDYQTVIEMLEMSVDEYIDLSSGEFKQYVQDKWAWTTNFKNLSATYNSKG